MVIPVEYTDSDRHDASAEAQGKAEKAFRVKSAVSITGSAVCPGACEVSGDGVTAGGGFKLL